MQKQLTDMCKALHVLTSQEFDAKLAFREFTRKNNNNKITKKRHHKVKIFRNGKKNL